MLTPENWFNSGQHQYDFLDFDIQSLVEAKKGRTVSVALPALNEAETVGAIVEKLAELRAEGLIDQIAVIDSDSEDETASETVAAGGHVFRAQDCLPALSDEPVLGKGDALYRSLNVLTGDIIIFIDADLRNFNPSLIAALIFPFTVSEQIKFVKGWFSRLRQDGKEDGGRVTELLARPLIATYVPSLAYFLQPLCGCVAGTAELLRSIPFWTGYGVEMGMLGDTYNTIELDGIAQAHLGTLEHRNRPNRDLFTMACEIMAVSDPRKTFSAKQLDEHGDGFNDVVISVPQLREPLDAVLTSVVS